MAAQQDDQNDAPGIRGASGASVARGTNVTKVTGQFAPTTKVTKLTGRFAPPPPKEKMTKNKRGSRMPHNVTVAAIGA